SRSAGTRRRSGCASGARTRTASRSSGSVEGGAPTASDWSAAGAAKTQASDVAPAHRSVPSGLDLTRFLVGGDAVVGAVVQENVGIGDTAHRAVLVVDRRGLPGHAVQIIVGPLALHRREIHRLGVDEFRALDGVLGADSGARVHQV